MAFLVNGAKGAYNMLPSNPFKSAPSAKESEASSVASSLDTSAASSPNASGFQTPVATAQTVGTGKIVGLEGLSAKDLDSAVRVRRDAMTSPRASSVASLDSVHSTHSQPEKIVTVLQVDTNSAAYKKAEAMLSGKSTVTTEFKKQAVVNHFDTNTGGKLRNVSATAGNYIATALKGFVLGLAHLLSAGHFLRSARDTTNTHIDRLNSGSFTLSDRLERPGLNASQKDIEGMRKMATMATHETQDTFESLLGDLHPDALAKSGRPVKDSDENMNMADIRAEMKPQLQQWLDSITALGKGTSDEQYRALISIATQKVADKGLKGAEKTWLTDNAANFYGTSATGRIAGDLGKEIRATNPATSTVTVGKETMTGIQAIQDKIESRALLIAEVTGRDVAEVRDEIYQELSSNTNFTQAIGNYESQAYAAINKARDLDGLRASFLNERLSTLTALSMYHSHLEDGQKGSGEAYLKGILNLGGVEEIRKNMTTNMFINGDKGKGEQAIQNAEEIHAQFQEMFSFLDNLEEDFGAYVAQHEAEAQKQLGLIADLQTLKFDSENGEIMDRPSTRALDAELQLSDADTVAKISQPIDVAVAQANPISDPDLGRIFDILIGNGTEENPGAPTMLYRFMETLHSRKQLEEITGLAPATAGDVVQRDPANLSLLLEHGSKREEVAILRFTDAIQEVRVARGLAEAETAAVEQAAAVIVDGDVE